MINFYLTKDSGSTLQLDQVANVQTGLPDRNFQMVATLGEGGIITGVGQRTGREWSAQYQFMTEDEYERENFISFFNNNVYDDMYLYKECTQRVRVNITAGSTVATYLGSTYFFNNLYNSYAQSADNLPIYGVGLATTSVTIAGVASGTSNYFYLSSAASLSITNAELEIRTFTGRAQVYATIDGGESYTNPAISEGVGLKLMSESPFFTSTGFKTLVNSSVSTGSAAIETAYTVFNYGVESPPVFSFTLSSAATSVSVFQVKTSYGYGFRTQKTLYAGDVIEVDCTDNDLTFTVNGYSQVGYFTDASQPFNLLPGSNTLYCTVPETTAFNIKIYQRRV